MRPMILIIQLFLLISLSKTKATISSINTLPGCQVSCGGVPIPYPFGIGRNCSMSEHFELSCVTTKNGTSIPRHLPDSFMIMNINLSLGQLVVVDDPISYQCYNNKTKKNHNSNWELDLRDTPYRFNHIKNKFMVIGCDTLAYANFSKNQNYYLGGCVSGCYSPESLIDGSCSGIGCCQASIPKGTNYISFWFDGNFNGSDANFSPCSYAMLIEEEGFTFNKEYVTTNKLVDKNMSVVIDWAIGNTTCDVARSDKSSFACKSNNSFCLNSSSGPGYICNCKNGYQGNPYLEGGCRDIDECANQDACSKPGKCYNLSGRYKCHCPFGWRNKPNNFRECELNLALLIGTFVGIVTLFFLGIGTYVMLERRNLYKVKEKYFQQHGGWILLEKINSNQGFGFAIFTRQQIEQATKNFESGNIIGDGGQGTVYKGILRDQIVAIKKCKIVDESKKKEFGKEMLILSQINHKNIVKLLGCCLEVEVPILVYEFIPNGTLFHYIHNKKQGSCISLATRLRIAQESAEALAYLHFSASPPIFHGDVKSANILLDQNYTSKVSDFGASILAPTDEAQFVTLVQGTRGYLDPEYMQSCQLTNKSDVYSFGVVLLELLTRMPVIDVHAPEEERSLSSRFLLVMKDKNLQELLDDEIKHEDDMEVIMKVAELAKECLNIKGEERPTMKEVAEELDRIRKIKQHPWGEEYYSKDREILLGEASLNMVIEHTSYFSIDKEAEESLAVGR